MTVRDRSATAHVNKRKVFVGMMLFISVPFVMNGLALPRNEKQC